jgi:hypothetical protein
MDASDLTHMLPLLIPIIAITGGLAVAMLAIVTDYRRKRDIYEMHHKERMLAIERGMEVPPLPPEFIYSGRGHRLQYGGRSPQQRGLVMLFIGLALGIALWLNQGVETAVWALIPIGIGLANLIIYVTASPQPPPQEVTRPPGPFGHQ